MRIIMWVFALLVISADSFALTIDDLSNKDVASGLKGALTQSSAAAVARLGVENGFLGNPKVKIPLPDALARVEGVMRAVGMGKQADDLVVTMNRAAEAAVPEAKTLLVAAVKKMSVQDAKAILTGGDDAATAYFRRSSGDALHDRFLPIVARATQKVGLAEQYDRLAEKGGRLGLVDAKNAKLEEYVTRKALDGLFLVMAEEEQKIRQNPVQAAGAIAKKVFGVLAH